MPLVVQDWISRCSMKEQTVMLCALRGPDGLGKETPAKQLVRFLRSVVLHSADFSDELFMTPQSLAEALDDFIGDLESYPLHFVTHLTHAIEIVGYRHPDLDVATLAEAAYKRIVEGLHFKPETAPEMALRLRDITPRRESAVERESNVEEAVEVQPSVIITAARALGAALTARKSAPPAPVERPKIYNSENDRYQRTRRGYRD